jgi:hypothetical protein
VIRGPCRRAIGPIIEAFEKSSERQFHADPHKSFGWRLSDRSLDYLYAPVTALRLPLFSCVHLGVESVKPVAPLSEQFEIALVGHARHSDTRPAALMLPYYIHKNL